MRTPSTSATAAQGCDAVKAKLETRPPIVVRTPVPLAYRSASGASLRSRASARPPADDASTTSGVPAGDRESVFAAEGVAFGHDLRAVGTAEPNQPCGTDEARPLRRLRSVLWRKPFLARAALGSS